MFNRFLCGPLREVAGEGTGGTGAAATTPPTFDPAAFKTELMGEVNKTLNGFAGSLKKDIGKFFEPKEQTQTTTQQTTTTEAATTEAPKDVKTVAEVNGELVKLRKALETLTTENANSKKAAEDSEKKRLDTERIAAVDNVLADIQFASPKAREQFRAAYAGQVVRDDDGNLIVQTYKGPVAYKDYLTSEADASPHFLAPQGSGGSGATAGARPRQGQKATIFDLSQAEYAKLTTEQKNGMLQDSIRAAVS